jgi:NMD protein affecting ribosome stability and mRNA decay
MAEKTARLSLEVSGNKLRQHFQILCVSCGTKIREKASEESYGLCLKCFYTNLAKRLSSQPRVSAGEFVSER